MTNQKNLLVYVDQEPSEIITRNSVRDYNDRSVIVQFMLVTEFSLLNWFCACKMASQKVDALCIPSLVAY